MDSTPGRFTKGLPTPPEELTAVGWTLVSTGSVKAQLCLELILSHCFCFPSKPCGDTSRSVSEVEAFLPQQQHPLVFSPPFPLSRRCSTGSLVFPSKIPLIRPRAQRQDPILPALRCLLWSGRCLVLAEALPSAEQGGDQENAAQLLAGHAPALASVCLHPTVSAVCDLLTGEGVLCRQLQLVEL